MRNNDKLVTLVLLSLCILSFLSVPQVVYGTEPTDELENNLIESLNISILDNGPKERVIKCFDVNNKGWFAIGYRVNMIHVYDQYGVFQYGYRFDTMGDYGILFNGDNLVIYLVRSAKIVEIDPEGNCVQTGNINYSEELQDSLYRQYKEIGNTVYTLERDIGLFKGDFSRLVATDELNERTVLYDVTAMGYLAGIFHYFIIMLFPTGCIPLIVIKIKKSNANKQ